MSEIEELFIAHTIGRFYAYVHPRNRAVCRSLRADGYNSAADFLCDNRERGKFVRIPRESVDQMVSSASYVDITVTAVDMEDDWEGLRDPTAKEGFARAIQDVLDHRLESARMVAEGGPSTEENGV